MGSANIVGLTVDGVQIKLVGAGSGKPILYLHSAEGVDPSAQWFEQLARGFRVLAPWHPGFGHSELPREFRTVGDLAFFYLEVVRELDLQQAVLVGSSFGGWLAAEIAIRSTTAFSHLILLDPLGIKVGGREQRDIADLYAMSRVEIARRAYHDPDRATIDYGSLSDEQLLAIARSREAMAHFGWSPYMHDPSLRRWLRRIRIPTLVMWGASDGIVSPSYGRAFAAAIPGARFELIEKAGHYPHVEQPEQFLGLALDFLASSERLAAPSAV